MSKTVVPEDFTLLPRNVGMQFKFAQQLADLSPVVEEDSHLVGTGRYSLHAKGFMV